MIGMICDAVAKLSMVIIHGYPRPRVVPDMGTLRRELFANHFRKISKPQSEALGLRNIHASSTYHFSTIDKTCKRKRFIFQVSELSSQR
jgi:hypothetical protein